MLKYLKCLQHGLDKTRALDFIAPLLLRAYLAPVFWMAGLQKWQHIESTAAWFGNPDWGLNLPMPLLMAYLAAGSELLGAASLVLGLGLRWCAIPLMVTMLVAGFCVHWENGWEAIAPRSSAAAQQLHYVLGWLKTAAPSQHAKIIAHGKPVMLNNGIEFAATYFVMLLVLFFIGSGRYFSLDYWIRKRYIPTEE